MAKTSAKPKEFVISLNDGEFAELVKMYRAVAAASGDALAERVVSESIQAQFSQAIVNEAISITQLIRTANA